MVTVSAHVVEPKEGWFDMKKGYHRMPDGKIMKDSEHKKTAKKSTASSRGDGICRTGKTRGKIC